MLGLAATLRILATISVSQGYLQHLVEDKALHLIGINTRVTLQSLLSAPRTQNVLELQNLCNANFI